MITVNNNFDIKNIIIPVFENEQIAAKFGVEFENYLSDFKGNSKEQVFVINQSGQKVYFLGLGKKMEEASVQKIFRSFFFNQKSKLSGNVSIKFNDKETEKFAASIAHGIFLSRYDLGLLKKADLDKKDWFSTDFTLNFDGNVLIESVEKGKKLAETQAKMMSWVDMPANYKTPSLLATWIQQSGEDSGYEVEVFDEQRCEEMGLKALLAVGRGSIENPAKFVLLKYSHPHAQKTIGLIGKGVTFDTGGVSLKPGDNMNYMKSDMGGAAAVVGTIEMAAKLKLKVNIIGAIPLTENCIDSMAIKPGDVIGSYSGKTIEVINTDAEGRLILADGLTYIKKNYNPDVMIDLATLTGNCIQALGYAAAALLSNNDDLAGSLINAGQKTGEKVWRMPLWDDYKDMMKSDVADIKNLSSAPIAGAITAAKFLEEFIDGHTNWAHLDIAGVAFGDSEFGSMKSATGYGVKLLVEWLEGQ